MRFSEFRKSKARNAWIKEPGIEIYVRRSIIEDSDFDLANMQATKPGKGALTKFLDRYEPRYRFYFENVYNERLQAYLLRRGYVLVSRDPHFPCFLKPRK